MMENILMIVLGLSMTFIPGIVIGTNLFLHKEKKLRKELEEEK